MLRILSWNAGLGCDKAHPLDYKVAASQDHSCSPIPSLCLSTPMKRKRSPSLDACTEQSSFRPLASDLTPQGNHPTLRANATAADVTKSDMALTAGPSPISSSACVNDMHSPSSQPQPTTLTSEARLNKLRQTISSQLSLEILLKHKELRLIDQEMAKCQVALEQLRRCTEVPFPSMQSPSEFVSQGRGPAIRRLGQRYPPESPAAWGVTDGPYSRHYAQWLLPDRRFDGGEPEPEMVPPPSAVSSSGRSTRGYYVDVLAGKTVKSRSRTASGLQALPAGYAQPKEKATGPMILKRRSDGAMVKLVCPDCGRLDFGSAQGFINHCRIGHSRSFASHDAAAEACGEAVEYNENGTIKGLETMVNNSSSTSNTSVHPLVRSAKFLPQSSPISPCLKADYIPGLDQPIRSQTKAISPNFQASHQTPHLSALIENQGLDLDLGHLVKDAKTRAEIPETDLSEDEMDMDSPRPAAGGRHPQVAGTKQPLKSSMDHVSTHLLNGSTTRLPGMTIPRTVEGSTCDTSSGVLPSPTNESTQAPSLVDDDEDFDPQSPVSNHEMDDADLDFQVHDDEHCDRASSFQELATQQPTCSPGPSAANGNAPANTRDVHNSEKRVTFVTSSSTEGTDRKRRKI